MQSSRITKNLLLITARVRRIFFSTEHCAIFLNQLAKSR
jgi:hypothetical protein